MKKFLTSILAFLYLSTSMGATIHLHYCMGKLASWGLIDHERKNCAQCGMIKKTSASQNVAAKWNAAGMNTNRLKQTRTKSYSLLNSLNTITYPRSLLSCNYRAKY